MAAGLKTKLEMVVTAANSVSAARQSWGGVLGGLISRILCLRVVDILMSLIFYVGKLRFGLSNLPEVIKWEAKLRHRPFCSRLTLQKHNTMIL